MKTLHKYIIMACCAAVAAGCNDTEQYEPGPADAADCMGVYFDEGNDRDFIFVPGEPATVALLLHRQVTSAAADVPVIGKSTVEGVTFPATVHFDQGAADATIEIDCSGLPVKQIASLSVYIDDAYINHYAESLFCYETSALVSQWEPANKDGSPVTFWFTDTDYNSNNTVASPRQAAYKPVQSDMEVLPGAGRIRIHDFLNTGTTINFELTPSPFADFSDRYRVSPLDHNYSMLEAYEDDSYGDDWYNAWFLLDDDDDYQTLGLTDLDGNYSEMEYPSFYWYSVSYAYEYAYATLRTGSKKYSSISIGMGGVPSGDVTLPSYFYLFFRWDGETGL